MGLYPTEQSGRLVITRGRIILIAFVLLWWLASTWTAHQGWLNRTDEMLEDMQWRLRWALVPDRTPSQVVTLLITRNDVVQLSSAHSFEWPLNRRWFGRVVEVLQRCRARAVGFDMAFLPSTKTDGDPLFAAALASWPRRVVLGTELQGTLAGSANDEDDDEEGYGQGLRPTPVKTEFASPAWGLGAFNFLENREGTEIPRVMPLHFPVNGRCFPGLALATWMAGQDRSVALTAASGAVQLGPTLRFPAEELIPDGRTFFVDRVLSPIFPENPHLRFHALFAFHDERVTFAAYKDAVSFAQLALCNPNDGPAVASLARILADKYVLIGVGENTLGDVIQMPNQPRRVAGVMLHAAMLDGLTRHEGFLSRCRSAGWRTTVAGIALALSLFVLFTQARFSPLRGLLTALGGFITVVVTLFALFCGGVLLPWSVIPVTFIGVLPACYFYGYLVEGREKAQIKDIFKKQVSPEIVDELLTRADEIMAARRQEISVGFIDVCGFTSFSESHSPERVLVQLNHYFSRIIPDLMQRRVTLDKLIGDALMITTGVPLPDPAHAVRLVEAAAAIRKMVAQINTNLPPGFEPFTVSCGINSGDAIVGNVGSRERMEYTVIGDVVNLAARLQGVAKSQEIVVGPRTYEMTRDRFQYRPLPPLTVKGKSEPVQAYMLLEPADIQHSQTL